MNRPMKSNLAVTLRCILAACVLAMSACSFDVEKAMQNAQAFRAKGDNASAAIELKNVLTEEPKNHDAFFLLGQTYLEMGDLLNAENSLRRAIEHGHAATAVLPLLGRALLELEKFPEAIEELKLTAKLDTAVQAELSVMRGRAFLGVGSPGEAKTQFLTAIRDKPGAAKIGLAQVAAIEGDRTTAEKLIEEVMVSEPNSAESWIARGDLLNATGNLDEALAAYEKASKIAPKNPLPLITRGTLLATADKLDLAKPLITQAEALAPAHPALRFAKGLILFREGKNEEALVELQAALDMMPKHYPTILLGGTVHYALKNYDISQQAFGTYLTRFPGNTYARRMMGTVLLAKGQPRAAVDILTPALKKTGDVALLAAAAEAYKQVGKLRDAEGLLARAAAIEPKNAEWRTRLGLVRVTGGARRQGIADLEAAIALNPKSIRADEALVMTNLAQNQFDTADKILSALEQRMPDQAGTHTLRGTYWMAKKDDAKARASFEQALRIDPAFYTAAEALGDIDMREGKPDALRQRMEALLKASPKHLAALLAIAKLDLAQGRQKEGLARIRRAISEHPESINALLLLAQIQMQGGEYAEAASTARQARDKHPLDTRALNLLADAQRAAGDIEGAILTVGTLTTLQPHIAVWQVKLSGLQLQKGDLRIAHAAAMEALKVEPDNLEAKAVLADVMLRNGQLVEVLQFAEKIQKEQPRSVLGYWMEGEAQMARKDFAKAAAAYQRAAAIRPGGDVLIKIHQAQSALPGASAPDTALRDWLTKNPEENATRFYLAGAYSRAGRHKEAVGQFRELLQRMPKDFRVLNNLAWALFQSRDPQALEYARQALQLKPKDAATMDTLGWIQLHMGKETEAVQQLIQAVALDGSNPEIRFHLVQALLKIGDTNRAKSELRTALGSDKPFPQRDEARALLVKLGS